MDIREIEAICAVTRYNNYSEAAYRISSSPSVISKQIARAEEELGLRIFERATKSAPVRLTKEGAELIGYLQEIMENYRLLRDKVAAFKVAGSRSVTVGLHRFLGHFREKEVLSRFVIQQPDIIVHYFFGADTDLIRALTEGRVDIAFFPLMEGADQIGSAYEKLAEAKLVFEPILSHSRLCIGLPADHPLAGCDVIRRSQYPQLHDETFLLSTAQMGEEQVLKRTNLREVLRSPHELSFRYVDFSEPSVLLDLVSSHCGVLPQACIVPRRMGGVRFVPLEDNGRGIILYLISRQNAPESVRLLRRCAQEFAAENRNGGTDALPDM